MPRTPVHGIDLETYATLSAQIAERPNDKATLLSAHALDEMSWIDVEKAWLLRVAVASMQNDLSLGQELDRHLTEAQNQLGSVEPTRSLEEYANMTARIESGVDVPVVLSEANLSLGDWTRLSRAWTARIVRDSALADTFRQLVKAARVNVRP